MVDNKFISLGSGEKKTFLVKKVKSNETYKRLLEFFHRNPGTYDKLSSLANRLGLNKKAIKDVAEEMVSSGLLNVSIVNDEEVLFLNDEVYLMPEVKEALAELMQEED